MNAPVRMESVLPSVWHEYSTLFEMIPPGKALDALREDIRQHGVREPVVTFQGRILDGRNRYMCARDLGVDFPVREFDGDEADALAFVISSNLHRRHLSESQRAMVAQKMARLPAHRPEKGANLHRSAESAADMLNVSERSVKSARKVAEEAPPEITRAVEDGRLAVSLAEKLVDLPDEAKAEVISAPPEQTREVARDVVKRAHVANNTGNNEWYTPPQFIEAAREVMGGIDLDPASSEVANRTVGATQFFTAEIDGLAQEWPIGRIWCNPPYAQPLIAQFCKRLADEVQRGSEAIVLVNNGTETEWFQTLGAASSAICFPRSRIRFLDPEGNPSGAPLQGQAILYCGPNKDAFYASFAALGLVLFHD